MLILNLTLAVMAEWLRRWTRNPMGYSRTGSNPVHSAALFYVSKISFFPPKNIYFSFFFCKRGWHCWCSGIIQDSHSWDLGSIPRQCMFSKFLQWKKNLNSSPKKSFPYHNPREGPELNQGPLDLQLNALPLSYTPIAGMPICHKSRQIRKQL